MSWTIWLSFQKVPTRKQGSELHPQGFPKLWAFPTLRLHISDQPGTATIGGGWRLIMVPKKNTSKDLPSKKNKSESTLLNFTKISSAKIQGLNGICSKTKKKRLPELNSTWFFGFFPNSQGLLHIVWAKCITSLKVWTITCLAGGLPWESLDVWDISPRKITATTRVGVGHHHSDWENMRKSCLGSSSQGNKILKNLLNHHLVYYALSPYRYHSSRTYQGAWEITSHLNPLLSHKLCCCMKDSNPKSPKKSNGNDHGWVPSSLKKNKFQCTNSGICNIRTPIVLCIHLCGSSWSDRQSSDFSLTAGISVPLLKKFLSCWL